ncbi:Phosphoglycolate phosphatase [compost metagenome]
MECVCLAEQGGRLFEQLEEVLKVLSAKYKLFIVSNCQAGYIEAFYKYHQLQKYFADFENPGRTGLSKGENIKLVMERNNLKNPVYVGDTEKDLKAARDAGIPFVFASYGFGEVSDYEYIIHSFEGLLELF